MNVIIDTSRELYIGVDSSGSMNTRDAPNNRTRIAYACERLSEVLKRLPREQHVTLLRIGGDLQTRARNVLSWRSTGTQACAALGMLQNACADAEVFTGDALEFVLDAIDMTPGAPGATLLLVTDGAPRDVQRFEAFAQWNALHDSRLSIAVLLLGGCDPEPFRCIFGSSKSSVQHFIGELTDVEDFLVKVTSVKPDAAHPETQPPSVAPPTPDDELFKVEHVSVPAENIGELPAKPKAKRK